MKKLIFSAAVLASAFFAASCQQEMLDPQAEGTTVTYTVEVPDAIATKAIGDQITDVDKVYYEVYRAAEVGDLAKTPVYEGEEPLTNNQASFDLEFVKDQNFVVLFWAQKSALVQTQQNTNGMYNINDLRAIKLVNPGAANNAAAQVFAGNDTVTDCVSAAKGNVTLTRPVSQINVYTTTESLNFGDVTIGLNQSSMTVAGLYNTFNVATGDAVVSDENKATFEYTEADVPSVAAEDANLKYVAMNYVGFASQAGTTATVDFTIWTTTEAKVIEHTVSNVPVKPNYRTNIVGNLISATTDYNVTLNNNWADAGKDMEVLADGIVKNINGDYEISTAKGLAYAISNVFANGGTFYVLKNIDMTGVSYDPADVPAGTTVHIVGETPVVTRSSNSVVITGLTKPLLKTVQKGAAASFANIHIDAPIDFVKTNKGVVAFNNCDNTTTDSADDLVGDNTNGTIAEEGTDINNLALEEALAAKASSIKLAGDITASETIVVDYAVTIDGCGHKLTSSAGRAINVSGANGVTINNLVIDCSGERAINIIQKATNVTIDNVTAKAANYTVNVAASAPGAVVNIENSTLNGLCTVNVASPSASVTINNSTINCNDTNTTEGEAYAAIGLNKDAVRGQIIVTNSTINVTEGSDSMKARNGAEDGIITIDGSAEEVLVNVAVITFEGSDYYYAYASLDAAISDAQKYNRPVTLIRDLTVAETVTIEEGQTVVLDLNGKTLAAADMNVIKNNGGNLTIKNGTVTRTGDVVGYSVNNASGEIVIDNATIQRGLYTSGSKMTATNANISHEQSSRHAIYAWNCEVTIHSGTFHNDNAGNATLMASGSSVVTINGGTFSIADGRSSLGWTSSMIDQNSTAQVLVKGGLFNGGFRINSADTKLTIEGGEFNTNNGSGFTDYNGTMVVKGGKFTDEGAQNWAKKYIAEGFKMNADGEVVEKDYVAQAEGTKYESLQEAFNAGGEITLLCDVTVDETVVLADAKTAVLDLKGKTITGTMHKSVGAVVENNGTLTIKNGTISSTAANGGSAVMNKGTLKVEDVTLNGAPNADGSWPSYTVNNTAVMTANNTKFTSYHGSVSSYGEGAVVTLNNSEIDMAGIPGFTSHGIYTYNGGKVVVNGGTYANKATDQVASGASVINGAVEVYAGTFTGRIENYYGTPVLKGGTYSVDPTRFVATGYKTQQDDKVWNVVQE